MFFNYKVSQNSVFVKLTEHFISKKVKFLTKKIIFKLHIAKPVHQCDTKKEDGLFYHIEMLESKHRFHKNFPLTTIWGYNGTYPGQVTSIIMHFKEHAGDYVWHCHILEHEDNDMMRPLVVVKN